MAGRTGPNTPYWQDLDDSSEEAAATARVPGSGGQIEAEDQLVSQARLTRPALVDNVCDARLVSL